MSMGTDMQMWHNEADPCRKRKREWRSSTSAAAAGDADKHQSLAEPLQEPVHTKDPWIDLGAPQVPLPPGWEQCLDLQTGQMYFMNRATQAKTLHDPRNPYQMNALPYPASQGSGSIQPAGAFHHQSAVTMEDPRLLNPAVHQSSGCILNSSMSTTICHHCYTFVMISQSSPQCPNCKTACNTGLSLAAMPME